MTAWWFVGLIALGVLWWGLRRIGRMRIRRRLMATPLPPAWVEILEQQVALYRRLPRPLRQRLHGLIQVFLAEKEFQGCQGQEITDLVRVTVAAQACLLILTRPGRIYPRLHTILVYPSAYLHHHRDGGSTAVAGESWNGGPVVLAWDHIRENALDPETDNLVLHEFAHQLDQEDGADDGVPILDGPGCYSAWARVCRRGYADLQKKAAKGRRSLLDKYGATNAAEFFAVATETFFEKSARLASKDPELYKLFTSYYGLDPAAWEESR